MSGRKPMTGKGHLRGAIGDCRCGGETTQGGADGEQRAGRAVNHRGHAGECRGLQGALTGKFLHRSPHRRRYPQSDRLLRGGDPARPALRARLCEAVVRGAESGRRLRQSCDQGTTRGDRKSRASAKSALALDLNLAEAHSAQGLILDRIDYKFAEAEAEFRRPLKLAPQNAAVTSNLAGLMSKLGRLEEA